MSEIVCRPHAWLNFETEPTFIERLFGFKKRPAALESKDRVDENKRQEPEEPCLPFHRVLFKLTCSAGMSHKKGT